MNHETELIRAFPEAFTMMVSWGHGEETSEVIKETAQALLQVKIDLKQVFSKAACTNGSDASYQLHSFIGYYKGHYERYLHKAKTWKRLDNNLVSIIKWGRQ